jgi:hypothetical protein
VFGNIDDWKTAWGTLHSAVVLAAFPKAPIIPKVPAIPAIPDVPEIP